MSGKPYLCRQRRREQHLLQAMTKPGFKHIANRLLAWILGVCLLIFVGFSLLLYQQTGLLIRHQAQSRAELAVANTVQRIESLLAHVERSVRTARSSLLAAQVDELPLIELLQTLVADKPEVFGMALALQPGTLPQRDRFAPYVYRRGRELVTFDLTGRDYDYLQQDWYRNTVDQARSQWSEPYYDRGGGNIAMVTYSAPIKEAQPGQSATVLGVVTADISLQTLGEMVDDIRIGSQGYGYILSASGQLITHPRTELRMASVEQLPLWQSSQQWRDLIQAMRAQRRGHAILPCQNDSPQRCWLSYEPLSGSDWSILIAVPMSDIEHDVVNLGHIMLALGGAAILLLGLLILWLSRRLTSPINILARHTKIIAQGKLDAPVPTLSLRDEIGSLSADIATMQNNLQQHIAQLTEETARRERMESELAIAASIQAQMLPDGGHSQVQHPCFQLAATVTAARQIGGDFYLYQLLDDGHLLFVVGDVSDKGIPAALFMAQAIAHIRGLLNVIHTPAALLSALNDKLLRDNENCMFVTAIAGTLNVATGQCHLACAGHAAPLLKSDQVVEVALESGPALGLLDSVDYPESEIHLQPAALLLLYTDGVDEACNEQGEQYGLPRLVQGIQRQRRADCETLVTSLLQEVLDYQHGAVFDDITLFAISRSGSP